MLVLHMIGPHYIPSSKLDLAFNQHTLFSSFYVIIRAFEILYLDFLPFLLTQNYRLLFLWPTLSHSFALCLLASYWGKSLEANVSDSCFVGDMDTTVLVCFTVRVQSCSC